MKNILIIAALVLLIFAAIGAFFIDDWSALDILGLMCTGLACFVAAHLPLDFSR